MTVVISCVPPCRGYLSALQITFARFDMLRLRPCSSISYIFGQEVVLPGCLLKLMEIDDNGPGATCQCTLMVQIGSKLRGNIGVMAEKAFQPGLPKLGSPLLFCILFRKLLCHSLKNVKPGSETIIFHFCTHIPNAFSMAGGRICSFPRAFRRDFPPFTLSSSVDRGTPI